ncbi:[citrate (pro-3S)-lyase] ligase [Lactobacillus xylocopicola]|uniref:[Citrate [pro-3S]-lyase] ligase n=1 Tax=Lactobacillus xylocopicola TaxID=2976676 RepID=A0ABM8BH07_9LACO|nr:[citrate (pro-3S)-lyase] ligase [Lactobacillus xylocopicola]BDR60559.1 [Citrate [pro-3S]-lyase] ligase [Lactobacillus xylocopicola]
MDKIVDLYLNIPATRKKWENFLAKRGITNFSSREVEVIDHTFGLFDDQNELVGTGSVAGNVLKYLAVCNQDAVAGARFNQLVTVLQQYLFNQNIYHSFVFTKEEYAASFAHLGFTELARTETAAFLESGTPDIDDFLVNLPQVANQASQQVAAIVMNANPFTLGHRQLVELASRENGLVYVFVVATDASLFNTKERQELVKAGTADLDNVLVVSGGDYLVSQSTFPAYFLKSPAELIVSQTAVDALVFKNKIAPALAIKRRYLGTEPFSRTTNFYNQSLVSILSPEIDVRIVERFSTKEQIITATRVRQLLKTDQIAAIAALVPASTMNFMLAHQQDLQKRIKEGMNINGN